jgi:hypothetical protein
VATVTGDAFGNPDCIRFLCYKRRNLERSFKRIKKRFRVTNPFYFFKIVSFVTLNFKLFLFKQYNLKRELFLKRSAIGFISPSLRGYHLYPLRKLKPHMDHVPTGRKLSLLKKKKMKILLLGSGELGKEFTIAAQRIGQTIIAVDSYENAPAMQVAHGFEVINMLDGEALDRIVAKHKPDFIVPEIEAIRTERFTITKNKVLQFLLRKRQISQ